MSFTFIITEIDISILLVRLQQINEVKFYDMTQLVRSRTEIWATTQYMLSPSTISVSNSKILFANWVIFFKEYRDSHSLCVITNNLANFLIIYSRLSIFIGSPFQNSTNTWSKRYIVVDGYYIVRPMMIVSVLNNQRLFSKQYGIKIIYIAFTLH